MYAAFVNGIYKSCDNMNKINFNIGKFGLVLCFVMVQCMSAVTGLAFGGNVSMELV